VREKAEQQRIVGQRAADPDAIGVKGPAEEESEAEEPYGFRNYRVVEGYSELALRIARSLGDRLRLGVAVTDVIADAEGVLLRVLRAADGGSEEIRTSFAVVTVPLGVLKTGAPRFDPPLEPSRRAAIERIGFGHAYALQLVVRGNGGMRRALGDYGILWGDTATSFHRPRAGLDEPVEVVTAFTVGREARRRCGLTDEELATVTVDEAPDVWTSGVEALSVTCSLKA
jgi:monoamine oxidase